MLNRVRTNFQVVEIAVEMMNRRQHGRLDVLQESASLKYNKANEINTSGNRLNDYAGTLHYKNIHFANSKLPPHASELNSYFRVTNEH